MTIDYNSLEGAVTKEQIIDKAKEHCLRLRNVRSYIYVTHGDYEIRYVEVMEGQYILDGVGRIRNGK